MIPIFHLMPVFILSAAFPLHTDFSYVSSHEEASMQDRARCLPDHKFLPLSGKVVGVLVGDAQAVLHREGRSGPPDALVFSRNNASYSWVYVPVRTKPQFEFLNVPVGEKGEQVKRFDSLSLGTAMVLRPWGVTGPYSLVEVEVNDGLGSPAGESFVATQVKRLDGTAEYPMKVVDVMSQLRKQYQAYLEEQQKAIDVGMKKAQKAALGDRNPTGPRETSELLYVTWLSEGEQLRVCFRTRVNDGLYRYGKGIEPSGRDKAQQSSGAFPPSDQKGLVRFGTVFGVELGMSYEMSKTGAIKSSLALPLETFHTELPPPGGVSQPVPPGASPSKKSG